VPKLQDAHQDQQVHQPKRGETCGFIVRFLFRTEFGTVAEGKRADLILLDRNPLDDVSFASRRVGVMIKGQWLPQSELQKKLDEIASSDQRDK